MNILSQDPPGKKRKVNRVHPALNAEDGHQNARAFTIADANESSTMKLKSDSMCDGQYHVSCTQRSTDTGADVPSKDFFEGPNQAVITDIRAEPDPGIRTTCEKIEPDLQKYQPYTQVHGQGNDLCPYDEALSIRYRARNVGLESFLQESVAQGHTFLKKVCSAFGVPPQAFNGGLPNTQLLTRLKRAIVIDMGNRIKLHQYNSAGDAIALTRGAKNIMIITGAGISTSLDIPDFRSRGGLYSKLRSMGFEEPESVFSRDTFEQDPRPFFSVASMILPPTDGRFTPAHAFLRMLQDKGKLLTLYTQNIDGIDLKAGIRRDKLVQLHGSFETATCITCGHQVNGDEIFPEIWKGEVPNCTECAKERQIRIDQMIAMRAQSGRSVRRRTQRSCMKSNSEHSGIMRPDIVFMGEPPKRYLERFQRDCDQVDLVIVMGTSLPVEPVNTMPNRIPPTVPQIYIGKNQMCLEKYKRIDFDIQLLGECDVAVELLAKGCGWDLKHDMLPKHATIEVEPWYGLRHCHLILRDKVPVKLKNEENELEA